MEELWIRQDPIRLDQLLKLANWVMSGAEAKMVIQEGLVSLNGEVCLQRGKKIHVGDQVDFEGQSLLVKKSPSDMAES
ncbi:MAG: RNA-binding S4 domain-containing protein [Firmicutes bacterium]|nr:RNA-binding S4 domain-containing protein [Bacillota bacterium]